MVKLDAAVRVVTSSIPLSPRSFSRTVFKQDVSRLCAILTADYKEDVVDKIIDTYHENFNRGAVLWKATNRQEDGIALRFYERKKVDVIGPAIKNGLLTDHHTLIPLVSSWANLYSNAITSCDFDPAKGLNKTWVWLGGRRPLKEILNAPHVPKAVRDLEAKFKGLNLTTVRHAAVDWRSLTINIYFWVPKLLTLSVANSLINLAKSGPIDEEELADIQPFLRPHGFTFATTIEAETGEFKRVAFYALQLDNNNLPVVGDRLDRFFKDGTSYDKHDLNIVAWSFGRGENGSSNYIKGERSYCGDLEDVLTGWGSPLQATS